MSTIQEDIREGNKLIAEFMGARKRWFWFGGYHSADNVSDEPSKTHAYKQENGPYKKANKYYQYFKWQMHPEDKSGQFDEWLKYNSSWNWLMPVKDKIDKMDNHEYDVVIWRSDCHINNREQCLFESSRLSQKDSLIEIVWGCIVQFIRWYNQQSSL